MPTEHFTRTDLIGVALGTLLFGVFLIPPGFLFGWSLNLLSFRKQSRPWQVLTSVPLSIGIAPIVTFLAWSYAGQGLVWAFYAVAAVFCAILLAKGQRGRISRFALVAMLAWLAIVWLSGIDLQFGNRLYTSVLAYDFNLRTAFISGIARDGLPAQNPLFFPGHAQPLRYHY